MKHPCTCEAVNGEPARPVHGGAGVQGGAGSASGAMSVGAPAPSQSGYSGVSCCVGSRTVEWGEEWGEDPNRVFTPAGHQVPPCGALRTVFLCIPNPPVSVLAKHPPPPPPEWPGHAPEEEGRAGRLLQG